MLHRDVGLWAAERLASALDGLDVDRELRLELAAFRRTLDTHRKAGTPWRARAASDILASLDPTVWVSVMGLLDECPVVPAAMTAILDGRTTTVIPTEFAFISSMQQIDAVRAFVERLPELLLR